MKQDKKPVPFADLTIGEKKNIQYLQLVSLGLRRSKKSSICQQKLVLSSMLQ